MAFDLQKIDRRWIFLMIAVFTIGGLCFDVKLPQSLEPQVRAFHGTIDNLPKGSTILVSCDYGTSTVPELEPMHQCTYYHILKSGHKLLTMGLVTEAVNLNSSSLGWALDRLAEEGIKPVRDVDYISLGFKIGGDIAMQSLGSNFRKACKVDVDNREIWDRPDIPILHGIRKGKEGIQDIDLLISFTSGRPGVVQWLAQVQKQYKLDTMSGVTAVIAPELFPFFHSKQLEGFLDGLVGAAAYEKLLGREGEATEAMFVQSVVHYALVLIIIIGNIDYLIRRRRGRMHS
jgi:hypothetical protein